MKHHVTMRVGGPADLLLEVPTEQALRKVLLFCREEEVPYYVVGRGSNLLVSDRGVQGVVLLLTGDMRKIRREENEIVCGAGASLASVCSFAREHGLSGLEFAWGIPGSAGGAAYMNAGAYKGEMHDVLIAVRYMTPDGQIGEYHGEELQLFLPAQCIYRYPVCHFGAAVITTPRRSGPDWGPYGSPDEIAL